MKRFICLLTGLLLAAGCENIGYSHSAYQKKLSKWQGQSVAALYAAWGEPQQIVPFGNDTLLLTYYSSESQPLNNDYQPYASEMSYAAMEVPTYGLPPAPPLFYCKTTFVVRNNIVTGFNFNGDDCL